MKIFKEINLQDFDFWGSAVDHASMLDRDDFSVVESMLEDMYPDGVDETTVNDIFAHEFDIICQWLGYDEEDL